MMDSEKSIKNREKVNKVTVDIAGIPYTLRGDEDTEYVKKMASLVDEKMRKIMTKNNSLGINRVAILAALQMADDYLRMKDDYEKIFQELDYLTK